MKFFLIVAASALGVLALCLFAAGRVSEQEIQILCPVKEDLIELHEEVAALGARFKQYELRAHEARQQYVARHCQ